MDLQTIIQTINDYNNAVLTHGGQSREVQAMVSQMEKAFEIIKSGTKLRETPQKEVVYLIRNDDQGGGMIAITYNERNQLYWASEYSETVE